PSPLSSSQLPPLLTPSCTAGSTQHSSGLAASFSCQYLYVSALPKQMHGCPSPGGSPTDQGSGTQQNSTTLVLWDFSYLLVSTTKFPGADNVTESMLSRFGDHKSEWFRREVG